MTSVISPYTLLEVKGYVLAMEEVQAESFCQLLSLGNTHPPIELTDQTPTVIGRGPLTQITDKKCSRNQVEVTADFERQEATLKQLGAHPCRAGGKRLSKNESYILGSGGTFELLEDQYKYRIYFGKRVPESVLETIRKEAMSSIANSDQAKSDQANRENLNLDDENHENAELKSDATVSRKRRCSHDDTETQPKRMKLGDDKVEVENVKTKPHQKSLDTFFGAKPLSSNPGCMELKCKDDGSLIVLEFGPPVDSSKIASFDLDGTLIETVSGRKFATGPDDWKLLPKISQKLQALRSEGHKIFILTNQLGISRGKPTRADFQKKIDGICKKLQVPLMVLAATVKDVHRKPCTGMWQYLSEKCVGSVVDLQASFYVGDAAGREANWKPGAKKDFSSSDRRFAANLDLKFMTPEEYFLGQPTCKKFTWGAFDPRALDYSSGQPKLDPQDANITSKTQEVVVFTGCPASGKSSFYRQYMQSEGYVHVNRDKLGSWQKCVAECKKMLQMGKSVVVDNTNPDVQSRLRYIECAKQRKVPVRSFLFLTSKEHAQHNNVFRELTVKEGSYVKVNDMVFNVYKSKFSEPQISEGFSEVVKVAFTPSFGEKEHEMLYKQFLIA